MADDKPKKKRIQNMSLKDRQAALEKKLGRPLRPGDTDKSDRAIKATMKALKQKGLGSDYQARSGKDRRKLDRQAAGAVSENLRKAGLARRHGLDRREGYSDQRGIGMKSQRVTLPKFGSKTEKGLAAMARNEQRKREAAGDKTWQDQLKRHDRGHERAEARMDKMEKADVLNKFIKKHQERHYISKDEIQRGLHPETEKALDAFKKKYGDTNLRGKITAVKASRSKGKISYSPGTLEHFKGRIGTQSLSAKIAGRMLKGGALIGLSAALGAATKVGIEAYKASKEKEENK